MKASRAAAGGDSSSNTDNSGEFIEIVKKYDIVYNSHHPDYKNTEVKLKAWDQVGQEIGLSVEAAKRKWKNLRDSYTKYLRSFRTGTKTSKKYQYWAHAEHMEFLKPYQGPGRTATAKPEEGNILFENDESDLGYQMLTKATSPEDDVKLSTTTTTTINVTAPTCTTSVASSLPIIPVLPVPSLPKVQLPPLLTSATPIFTTADPPQQVPLPLVVNERKLFSSTVSSVGPVGCLIIEPTQLFASVTEPNKNGISSAPAVNSSAVTTTTSIAAIKSNPPLITKIRRVQPSLQTAVSYAAASTHAPSATRTRKVISTTSGTSNSRDLDISSVLQANRELDATCLFFLSLAKTVRTMPTKYQSLVKMRCMRIVSDIELEVENYAECNGIVAPTDSVSYFPKYPLAGTGGAGINMTTSVANGSKGNFVSCPSEDTTTSNGMTTAAQQSNSNQPTESTEHFLYVMSPSRVEGMIDISSEDEADATTNGN